MPLVNDGRTKVFDTFVVVSPEDCVVAAWPEVALTPPERELLRKLLAAMSYFGRAELWIEAYLFVSVQDVHNATDDNGENDQK
jgi:hypothetical protein